MPRLRCTQILKTTGFMVTILLILTFITTQALPPTTEPTSLLASFEKHFSWNILFGWAPVVVIVAAFCLYWWFRHVDTKPPPENDILLIRDDGTV
ncbi:hypothetical protein Zmor_012775 [Zophobas morio]|uniref:Uncharacterized protein n=1 Tax=Zophobas morio TaxID=2755281 RepID=A0AA38MEM3_9CUCU|nr:hypothetical protein Zmor_012775 [Zophobas morio]